jgi:hypothetical protein
VRTKRGAGEGKAVSNGRIELEAPFILGGRFKARPIQSYKLAKISAGHCSIPDVSNSFFAWSLLFVKRIIKALAWIAKFGDRNAAHAFHHIKEMNQTQVSYL